MSPYQLDPASSKVSDGLSAVHVERNLNFKVTISEYSVTPP